MKSRVPILVWSLLLLFAAVTMAAEVAPQKVEQNFRINRSVNTPNNELDEDTLLYSWDFEDVDHGWRSVDLTGSPAMWRTSDFNAYEDGISFWAGDPDIPGYDDSWLQYLDSPTFDLTDAGDGLTMFFQLRYGFESGDPANPDFDGWDGCNVWISIDNGMTWEVLTDPSLPYDETSLYSFALRGVGTGIPGWSGVLGDFEEVSFDLSGYAGEAEVQIRFAVATDNGVNSRGHPDWVSMIVDDIIISDAETTYLENNADDVMMPDEFVARNQEGTGILFELQTDESHSPDNAWQCANGDTIFSRLISPTFLVPPSDLRSYITYWVYCDWPDSDGDGDNTLEDYYQIEVLDAVGHYEMVAYDYGYEGAELDWIQRTNGLMNGARLEYIELTNWAEQEISIAFRTITDDNDDGGVGSGLFIDDVQIWGTTGWEYDLEILPLYIPFPTTVGRLVPAMATFTNAGNNPGMAVTLWSLGGTPNPFAPAFEMQPGDTTQFFLDNLENDGRDGWVPTTATTSAINARIILQGNQDENIANNQTPDYNVDVLAAGNFELGYDDRNATLTTTRFEMGEGPITHFWIPEDLDNFNITDLRVLWNGDLNEDGAPGETEVAVHVFAGGDTPGAELWSNTLLVTPDITNPAWMEVDVSGTEELQGLDGDFWLWYEINQPHAYPHIVFSERNWGEGFHYDFDGTTTNESNADWMIRVVGTAEVGVVELQPGIPSEFTVKQAYPNPFNPSVTLPFTLPHAGEVSVKVYDMLGRSVHEQVERFKSGSHTYQFSGGTDLVSGVYFVELNFEQNSHVQKVMLLK
ncbi:T9SS type A sorting domain-containing protein [bacterium]|nr:T9SS type A sorting domain-containing protein [bacterium]